MLIYQPQVSLVYLLIVYRMSLHLSCVDKKEVEFDIMMILFR